MSDYLKALKPQERADLAKKAGIGDDYLYQIITGYRQPSPKLAIKLEEESDGQVNRHELRPDIFGEEGQAA